MRRARRATPDALIVAGVLTAIGGLYLMFGPGPALLVLGLVIAVFGWLVS